MIADRRYWRNRPEVKRFPTFAHSWYWIIDLSIEKLVANEIKGKGKIVLKETYCIIGDDVLRVD